MTYYDYYANDTSDAATTTAVTIENGQCPISRMVIKSAVNVI